MSIQTAEPLVFVPGETFVFVVRWQSLPLISKPIQGISRAGVAVVDSISHGMPDGWKCAISGVEGMTEANVPYPNRLRSSDFHKVVLVDANTVELPTLDTSTFRAYKGGGFLRYYTPTDLAGFTARMPITDPVTGEELFVLTTENGRIVIDNANKTITLYVTTTDIDALTWTKGNYALEMKSGGATPVATRLMCGPIVVDREGCAP